MEKELLFIYSLIFKEKRNAILYLRAIFAYAFAGLMVGFLWSRLASPFASFAGAIAALLIIAPVWYVCHYRGGIPQNKNRVAIDMGTAIATAVLIKGVLAHGFSQLFLALPTFLCLSLGAGFAGWLYAKIEKGGRK
ncbi:membrane protein [Streptococcus varani]|uniref:Membrane protein n=1 Tax=Streptococcus varani TaxID=1608583 RepID=A0A0E4CSN1_9STRE|nr:hypothetical protein [Streptococcus varani]CQR24815.1 membrane protein [Streptococcus varani]